MAIQNFLLAKELWEQLGDIPINSNQEIQESFYQFEKGTDCQEIWHWFEEHFNLSVVDDLTYFEDSSLKKLYDMTINQLIEEITQKRKEFNPYPKTHEIYKAWFHKANKKHLTQTYFIKTNHNSYPTSYYSCNTSSFDNFNATHEKGFKDSDIELLTEILYKELVLETKFEDVLFKFFIKDTI